MEAGLRLLREFVRAHPGEAAEEIERIDAEEAAAVLADAPPEEGARVLSLMGAMAAAEALEQMEIPSAVALLCRLDVSIAAMLLRRVALPSRQNVLQVCPEPWKASLEESLWISPESVGALMDKRAPVFPIDWKVSEVLEFIVARPSRLTPDVFVEDRDHRLKGRIDLRTIEGRLNLRDLRGVIAPDPPRLPIHTTTRSVREDALWRRFDVLPVVDDSGLFVGALPHRALRMAAKPESAEGETSAGDAFVEVAELAWIGYLAAVDVTAALTRSLTAQVGSAEAEYGAQD